MTDVRQNLIALFDAYTSATGAAQSSVSLYASGSGALLQRLRNGAGITVRRSERIVQWFSNHWPDGHPWPPGIERPAPAPGSPAAAPPVPDADPSAVLAETRERLARLDRLLDDPDTPADDLQAALDGAVRAATALGPDGEVLSPRALCEALKVPRHVYDGVARRQREGRPPPGRGKARAVWACLRNAGDVRFAGRAA